MKELPTSAIIIFLNENKKGERYDLAGKWRPAGSRPWLDLDLRGRVTFFATRLGLGR
jgi:hypothetical protein